MIPSKSPKLESRCRFSSNSDGNKVELAPKKESIVGGDTDETDQYFYILFVKA